MAIRLLLLREYLLANALKEHPKRRGEMEKYLESKGYPVEKKTIYRDLEVLQDYFYLQLEYDEHKKRILCFEPSL